MAVTSEREHFRVIEGGASDRPGPERINIGADLAAEVAVLGNVMIDPSTLDAISGFLRPEYFVSEAHRRTFEACLELRTAAAPLDVVAVGTWLRDRDRLVQVGGMQYLTQILAEAPACTTSQTAGHARHVRDRWVRRQLALEIARTKAMTDAGPMTVEGLIVDHRERVDALAAVLAESEQSAHVKDALRVLFGELEAAATPGSIAGRPRSGFSALDRLTGGLPVQLRVLAARPGMGKTSLATSMAVHVAAGGRGVFVASLETSRTELLKRIVCAEARVDVGRMNAGALTPRDWQEITSASIRIAEMPLWLDDDTTLTTASLWSKVRRTKLRLDREGHPLGLVVVDYLQLLRAPRSGMPREQVVAENTRALRAMAQELGCCVLALAQLNRACESRADNRPQLSDLRESGEIEQAARCVLSLYRDDYYLGMKKGRRLTRDAEVCVMKQNDGPSGTVIKLGFNGECLRFTDVPEEGDIK